MNGVSPGHNVIHLPVQHFSLFVPKYLLGCQIDHVHSATLQLIHLQKDNSMFLWQIIAIFVESHRHFLPISYLLVDLFRLLQYFDSAFLVIKQFDQIFGIQAIRLNIF